MIMLNRLYKFSEGLFCGCLVCFLVVGCSGKADSPEKDKKAQEIVRQKIPGAEKQPVVTATKKKKQTQPDKTAKVSAPAAKPAAPAVTKQAKATASPEKAALPAQPETAAPVVTMETKLSEAKQAEIAAITRQAAESDIEADIKKQRTQETSTGAQVKEGQDVASLKADGSAEAPIIDLGMKKATGDDVDGVTVEDEEVVDELYNPFAPLFQKQSQGVSASDAPSVRDGRPFLTELEKIDIGQLTLQGIIQAQSGNRAIVADARGKGYVVTEGTYIGLNSGTVENIESDRIAILETIGTRQSKTVLKLQKPPGE